MADDVLINPDDIDPQDPEAFKKVRALYEQAAKERAEQQSELASFKRKEALTAVGLDLSTPLGKYFGDTYGGDINDVETLKASAEALGVPKVGAIPPPTGDTPAIVGAAPGPNQPSPPTGSADRAALADGAPADSGPEPDPQHSLLEIARRALDEGASFQVAAGGMIGELAKRAHEGDERVMFTPGPSTGGAQRF